MANATVAIQNVLNSINQTISSIGVNLLTLQNTASNVTENVQTTIDDLLENPEMVLVLDIISSPLTVYVDDTNAAISSLVSNVSLQTTVAKTNLNITTLNLISQINSLTNTCNATLLSAIANNNPKGLFCASIYEEIISQIAVINLKIYASTCTTAYADSVIGTITNVKNTCEQIEVTAQGLVDTISNSAKNIFAIITGVSNTSF